MTCWLPQKYQFSLGEQLRRAALSIPTNLAEGSGRDSPKEERYFYGIAKGSVYEVVSLLVIIGKRGCLTGEVYREHYGEADEVKEADRQALKSHHSEGRGGDEQEKVMDLNRRARSGSDELTAFVSWDV